MAIGDPNTATTELPMWVIFMGHLWLWLTQASSEIQDFACQPNVLFIFLLVFRYLRLVVHLLSYWIYRPVPVPAKPTYRRNDVTVIIPTVDPQNEDFTECLQSVLANRPAEILIVTVGVEKLHRTGEIAARFSPKIRVTATNEANKRKQVAHALPQVKTRVTVLVDDHVFWPSIQFLPTLLAPFEDPDVGCVGTNKRVRRAPTGLSARSFWNFIGCLYLERHNFETRATNVIDGGVFVVSGRTSAHRTHVITDPAFISAFTNERFFFGLGGPLNADDDNFITRWLVTRGWKIRVQHSDDAVVETTLGTYPKFLSQCLRWARTTWRSNSASLFTDRTVWRTQPWCVYAVYLTSFVNFALFYDAALLHTLTHTTYFAARPEIKSYLLVWIVASKVVKLIPHFTRNPADLLLLPGYFAFAYYHSLIKLYAGLTFWVTAWGGRNLAAVNDSSAAGGLRGIRGGGTEDWAQSTCRSSETPASPIIPDPPVQRRKQHQTIDTPWGRVRTAEPRHVPARVLQSRPSSRTMKGSPAARCGCPTPPPREDGCEGGRVRRTWIGPKYERTWLRAEECERLHDGEELEEGELCEP